MEEETEFDDYKKLTDSAEFVWHEYMNGKYHQRMISIKDMLSEMSTLAYASEQGEYDSLMTLYRNGGSDALTAFNTTINVYTDEFNKNLAYNQSMIITILAIIFAIICCFSGALVVPIFVKLNWARKQLWIDISKMIIAFGPQIKDTCWERLSHIHSYDWQELTRSSNRIRKQTDKYGTHWIQIRSYILYSIMFLGSAGYLFAIWNIGQLNAAVVLQEKTDVINWSGYRRGLSQGVVFWQREIYLESTNSPLAYKKLIAQYRYHHDEYQVWETYISEIDDMQRKLFDITQIMSSSHEDLLLEDACLTS